MNTEDLAHAYVESRCSRDAMARLNEYCARLVDANRTQNLVSATTIPAIWVRHIADSAQLLDHVSRETGIWLDLGSGPGLPGLIVAIMRPQRQVVLVESRKLRIQWLEETIEKLGLPNCTVKGCDIKSVPGFPAGVISARAFAPLSRLVALSARFSTNDTEWVLPKGRSAAQEVEMLPKRGSPMFHVEQSITDSEAGIIVGSGRAEVQS